MSFKSIWAGHQKHVGHSNKQSTNIAMPALALALVWLIRYILKWSLYLTGKNKINQGSPGKAGNCAGAGLHQIFIKLPLTNYY